MESSFFTGKENPSAGGVLVYLKELKRRNGSIAAGEQRGFGLGKLEAMPSTGEGLFLRRLNRKKSSRKQRNRLRTTRERRGEV